MFDADAPLFRIALVAGLLAVAPLSGCLEPIGEATQQALAGENQQRTVDDAEEADVNQDAVQTYEAAFNSVEPGNETAEAVSMDIHVENPAADEVFDVRAYWDAEDEIVVVSFENGTPGAENDLQAEMMEGLLFGSVNKTSFFGIPPSITADYNASESWDEDPFNFSEASDESSQATDTSEESMDFSTMFEEVEELPDEANVSWNTITYEGTTAQEIEIHHENETDYVDLRAVVDVDEELPLFLEGTFENETGDRVSVEIAFAYGEDADHEYADELVRMEAMAITREDGNSLVGASNETQNWTVLPSQNPGLIGLEEVEVHLRSSQGGTSTEADSEVVLPAEDGRLVSDDVELVYEDVDGDGAVSPGDQIRFTPLSEQAQGWSVSLHDEETGMHVTPGPGALALVAAIAGLAGGLRVRRP